MQENTKEQEALKNFKEFFLIDMRIKQRILALAPDELDDYNEESRIEYTDKLYKELKALEIEFTEIAKKFEDKPELIEAIKEYFNKAKQAFLISKYKPKVINKLYQNIFSSMDEELIENVKKEFFGHGIDESKLERTIKGATSINELLHIFHSYLTNNNVMMGQLPLIATKQNKIEEPITLYGEETSISKELFEEFPLELDCDETNIVSMQDKILMMVRGRGHALTLDIDITDKDNILVRYFVPKICNREMVEALPGVHKKSITENGATGLFLTKKEEMYKMIFDFIEKVPTDFDNPFIKSMMKQPIQEFTIQNAEEKLETLEKGLEEIKQVEDIQGKEEYTKPKEENYTVENNQGTSKIKELFNKAKERLTYLQSKILLMFNKNAALDAPKDTPSVISSDSQRKEFQAELGEGIVETPRVDISRKDEGQRTTKITKEKGIGE